MADKTTSIENKQKLEIFFFRWGAHSWTANSYPIKYAFLYVELVTWKSKIIRFCSPCEFYKSKSFSITRLVFCGNCTTLLILTLVSHGGFKTSVNFQKLAFWGFMSFIFILLTMFSFFFRFQASKPFQFKWNSFHVMLSEESSSISLLCESTFPWEADLTKRCQLRWFSRSDIDIAVTESSGMTYN